MGKLDICSIIGTLNWNSSDIQAWQIYIIIIIYSSQSGTYNQDLPQSCKKNGGKMKFLINQRKKVQ